MIRKPYNLLYLFVVISQLANAQAFSEYIISKTYVDQGSYTDVPQANSPDVQVNLFTNNPKYPVRQSLFGHNAVAWQGNVDGASNQYVNYSNANYSLLRYPGGNWSNQFFWDGNLPSSVLTDDVVTGTVDLKDGTEGWMLGTDEFPDLLNTTGSDGIVCVNVGWAFYGTSANPVTTAAEYAASWVDHYNNDLGAGIKYWELGNENYGSWQAGYSQANPTMYANACVEFYNAMKAEDPTIEIGVVLYEGAGGMKEEVQGKDWNELVLPIVKDHMDFIIIHQYPHPSDNRNDILEPAIYEARASLAEVVEVIESQVETYTGKAKDHYPISVTEYNSRTGVRELSRSNTLFTALFLGEMADHNIGSAMQWSLDNGYDANGGGHGAVAKGDPFMTDGDANSSLYVHYYMNKYFGDTVISSSSSNSDIVVYGTTFSSGEVGALIVNIGSEDHTVELDANGQILSDRYFWHQIKGDESDFDRTLYVNGVGPSNSFTEGVEYCNGSNCATATAMEVNGVGGPQNYTSIAPYSTDMGSDLNAVFTVPAHSVSFMVFQTSSDQCAVPNLGAGKELCTETSIELNTQLSAANKTFVWKNELNETIGNSNKLLVNEAGTYTVWVDSNGCSAGDEVVITSKLINAVNDTICVPGSVSLSVTDAGTFNWYATKTGGTALATASNYSTSIAATDTFYVEDAVSNSVLNIGKSVQDGTISTFSDYTSTWKQINVVVEQDLNLNSVSVFVNSDNTNVQINLYESDGTTLITSFPFSNLNTGKQVLNINYDLVANTTYVIDLEGSDNNAVDWQDDNMANNDLDGYISFVNFQGWASTKYGFFYDWVISVEADNPCSRTPVYAVIDPSIQGCIIISTPEINQNSIQIYPNPISGNEFQINTTNDVKIGVVRILDIHGKLVFETKGNNQPILINELSEGVYFVKTFDSHNELNSITKVLITK